MFEVIFKSRGPVTKLPIIDYDEHFARARQTLQSMGIKDIKPVIQVKRKRKKK